MAMLRDAMPVSTLTELLDTLTHIVEHARRRGFNPDLIRCDEYPIIITQVHHADGDRSFSIQINLTLGQLLEGPSDAERLPWPDRRADALQTHQRRSVGGKASNQP